MIKRIFDILVAALFVYLLYIIIFLHDGTYSSHQDLRTSFYPIIIIAYVVIRLMMISTTSSNNITEFHHPKVKMSKLDGEYVPAITIPNDNTRYRLCCYQTARLNEKYCLCGRAISESLINYFNGYKISKNHDSILYPDKLNH